MKQLEYHMEGLVEAMRDEAITKQKTRAVLSAAKREGFDPKMLRKAADAVFVAPQKLVAPKKEKANPALSEADYLAAAHAVTSSPQYVDDAPSTPEPQGDGFEIPPHLKREAAE